MNPCVGTGSGLGEGLSAAHWVRPTASTTRGSNWMPLYLCSSSMAWARVSGIGRYGREAVIASKASATWRMRARKAICSPMRPSG